MITRAPSSSPAASQPYDIRYDFLPVDDAEQVYSKHPTLRTGVCPTCRGTRTYRWRQTDCSCDCELQIALAKHYTNAGIGAVYQRLDWSDIGGHPDLHAAMRNYLDNHEAFVGRGVGLWFWGDMGRGKTMVANLVLKDLVKLGYRCFGTTFAATVEHFTAGWRSTEQKEWFRRRFLDSQVVLLDDLGRELGAQHSLPATTFDLILRSRVQDGRPTLLTTNSSPSHLESGYGANVLSLLRECSVECEFAGTDFRPMANERTLREIADGETRPIA